MILCYLSLGCHNLTAGSSARRSTRLVRCALDLGICRFDVAPPYGLGTAETMLGRALGSQRNDPGIEITTKVGILPPPHGWAKAWFREPWRLLQRIPAGRSGSYVRFTRSSPPTTSPKVEGRGCPSPRDAAEQSLRALRVERLGALLTHESIAPAWEVVTLTGLEELKNTGLVRRTGFSGERRHVDALLKVADVPADIIQVPVLDGGDLPQDSEKRFFNLSRLAVHIAENPQARGALADATGRTDFGIAIAAAVALLHAARPKAVFLVNASSARRLAAVVTPLADGALDRWAAEFRGVVSLGFPRDEDGA